MRKTSLLVQLTLTTLFISNISFAANNPNNTIGQKIYGTHCAMCHNTGVAEAPKLGDKAEWKKRLKASPNVVYDHAINGFSTMPAKGGCNSCSNEQIKAAVDYLVKQKSPT